MISIRRAAAALVLMFATTTASAQDGRVEEHLTMPSQVLGKDVRYSLYLPPDFDTSKRAYPVIFLLHGGGSGEDTDWFRFGKIDVLLDDLIESGAMPPTIVVTPDGRRDEANRNNTYYMNDADGAFRWEDMFVQEFVPFIETTYRGIGTRDARGIAGLSMGGYGALAYSIRHPEMFVGASALSAAFRTDAQIVGLDQAGYDRRYGKAWGMGLVGEDRLNEPYRRYSVLDMVEDMPIENVEATAFYLDCGAEDEFFDGNALLHQKLRDKEVEHVFMIRPGGHDWDYWRTGAEGALLFLGSLFQQD
ncbi:alpha/beta hydrolase [Marinivivus vitaminiproducens]|uniref:alpha/beta hydrolase n=1 Tax=Marinivivus vitaminiproducens TaxID=3035935 RepID=UPI002798F3B2|nr:alpha/beta hydrolase-fold protein [Geminicoccaceae bacterium SCSIO 64248]